MRFFLFRDCIRTTLSRVVPWSLPQIVKGSHKHPVAIYLTVSGVLTEIIPGVFLGIPPEKIYKIPCKKIAEKYGKEPR